MKQSSLILTLGLALGLPAFAQDVEAPAAPEAADLGLELTVVPKQTEVVVGGRIEFTVKLTNTGDAPEELYELAEDRMVVSFDVQLDGGKTFIYEKIHHVPDDPTQPKLDWTKSPLEPGQSWTLDVGMPALQAGTFSVKAIYARPSRKPLTGGGQHPASPTPTSPTVEAAKVDFTVKPDGDKNAVEVRFITTAGPMRARLFAADALGTCLHFANLIQAGGEFNGKVRHPFYDGLTFHRVMPGFMIQGGDPKGDGTGGPGYSIPAEFALGEIPDHLKHHPGTLSMARSGHPDSAGCQFFIAVGSPTHLDGQYTSFGELTRGLDVAYSIAEVDAIETLTGEKSKPLERIELEQVSLHPVKR